MRIDGLLRETVEAEASDLHLTAGIKPTICFQQESSSPGGSHDYENRSAASTTTGRQVDVRGASLSLMPLAKT